MYDELKTILTRAPVVPMVVLHELAHAVPLAETLVASGLPVVEITLRTPVALAAIEAMRRAVPEALVGVGTLRAPGQLSAARAAGAQFGVSPGLTPQLTAAARESRWPFLPGVMTASELMQAHDAGFGCCKFFPAQQAGGAAMLKALHPVFPDVAFCPTGGINQDNAAQYLALPNVLCVGGSWITPPQLLRDGDWAAISKLARQAAALKSQ
jgi:2-dehydro-3-deoxyphosphogluconate aldolase/(4S)-4-hydroxy-2-oxoglutarate aldolase